MQNPILVPVVALAAWTMMMGMWMVATRVPAILKARMKLDPNAIRGEQMSTLPPRIRWKADNYNNLMEQPTVFYAIALTLAISGNNSELNLKLAWAYVGLRVVHSLVQSLINIVRIRFAAFFLASMVLIALIVNTLRSII